MDIAPLVVSAITGLVSGTFGSLVAPWINWGVEAQRERTKARRALLEEVRLAMTAPPPVSHFRKTPLYSRIKHLLSDETNACIAGTFDEHGNEVIQVVVGGAHGGIHPFAHKVLDEMSRIERQWKLV